MSAKNAGKQDALEAPSPRRWRDLPTDEQSEEATLGRMVRAKAASDEAHLARWRPPPFVVPHRYGVPPLGTLSRALIAVAVLASTIVGAQAAGLNAAPLVRAIQSLFGSTSSQSPPPVPTAPGQQQSEQHHRGGPSDPEMRAASPESEPGNNGADSARVSGFPLLHESTVPTLGRSSRRAVASPLAQAASGDASAAPSTTARHASQSRPSEEPTQASQISREVEALSRVTAALDGGNPRQGLHLLDEYVARFPGGALRQEERLLRARALQAAEGPAAVLTWLDAELDRGSDGNGKLRGMRAQLRAQRGRCSAALADARMLVDRRSSAATESLLGNVLTCVVAARTDPNREAAARLYLSRFPNGAHARQANELLGSARAGARSSTAPDGQRR